MTRRVVGFLMVAAVAWAASPASWEMNTYDDFVKGRFEGLTLGRDGRVTLAPKLDSLFGGDQPAVWSVAQTPDGALYLGTGHRGRLYKLDRTGRSEVLFTSAEPEIFTVTADTRGRVYFATSPGGKVYRVDNGKVAEWFAPGASYIWSLTVGRDGALFVGTGSEGKIYRVDESGKGELWYETGQAHVTSLAVDSQGRLLAGSEPNGILYRVEAKDRAFVLWDADLPEIRAIVPGSDGSVYAAAMGGSVMRQSQAAQPAAGAGTPQPAVTAPTISITVTEDSAAQGGAQLQPRPAASQPPAPAAPQAYTPPATEYSGVEKSALYRIRPDNTLEILWTSKEENAYDLVSTPQGLMFSTDSQGRIYRLEADRKATLVAETRESEALRLLSVSGGLLVATGNPGKLYRLGDRTESGSLESPVHDASAVSRWGKLSWQSASCSGCEVVFRSRAGNTARPDRTWSDWSDPLRDPQGSPIPSPNARYVQWKAELKGATSGSPSLDSVRLAYLPQNSPPQLKSITVSAQTASAGAAKSATSTSTALPTFSVTVTDTGETGASSFSGTSTQPLTRASQEQILLSWVGEDTDGDKLTYAVHFRGEQERDWKLLRANLSETQWALDAEAFADGRYYFRVTVSDRAANPPDSTLQADLVSAPILVDRTPPVVRASATRQGNVVVVTAEAEDAGSPLKSCEWTVDAGPWTPAAAEDGITDSMKERFVARIEGLSISEHLIVIRAVDSAGNAGLAKVVLR